MAQAKRTQGWTQRLAGLVLATACIMATPVGAAEPAQPAQARPAAVTWDSQSLMVDGKRVVLWAGEFHPFRLPSPSLWRDVLQKMKATGYNTVVITFNWSYHATAPGQYDFTGVRDVERAIAMAEELGLYVIVRPGPWLGADLDMGGLPGYMARQTAAARSDDPAYLKEADGWLSQVNAIIARHEITRGGKVVLYQMEDIPDTASPPQQRYRQHLYDKARADGITVPVVQIPGGAAAGPWALPVRSFNGYPAAGGFDAWGSDGARLAADSGHVRTAFGANLVNGVTIDNLGLAFGGTSWGWLAAGDGYSSYDYGAGIDEARSLRDRAYGLKQLGQFVQSTQALLTTLQPAAPLTASSAAVKLYHARSSKGHGDLIYIVPDPQSATGNDPFTFALTTRDGSYKVPQAGGLRLNGQDARLLVADYALERQHLVYSTSQLQTHLRHKDRDIALFYGPRDEPGETVLRFKSKPDVTVLSGKVTVTWDAKTKDLRLNYVHAAMNRVRIETGPHERLELLFAEDEVARTFWRPDTLKGPVLVRSNALIRTAAYDGDTLALTGDTSGESTLEIWGPQQLSKISFNGQQLPFQTMEGAHWVTGVAGPKEVVLPELMDGQWLRRRDSVEADPKFDDGWWRPANLKESTATAATRPLPGQPVLSMDDYGFHHGDVWYRGRFRTRGQSPETLNFTWNGGNGGVAQVWIDGRFIGERDGNVGPAQPQTTMKSHLYLPRMKAGEHVIAIMVRNNGHPADTGNGDAHRQARGLISVDLAGLPIAWKIQGHRGAEFSTDTVRGPFNTGGLYGEREGWHLPLDPFADSSGWELTAVDDDPPAPGTYWLRTKFKLNLPKDQDTQLGLVFGDAGVARTTGRTRVLIFLNGWHIGNFIAHIGPQKTFVLPTGILNGNGDNTLTFAVTTDGKPANAPEPVKLVVLSSVRGGVPVEAVAQPTKTAR